MRVLALVTLALWAAACQGGGAVVDDADLAPAVIVSGPHLDASFGAIVVLSRNGFEADRIDDYKGLNARSPWMAWLVLCVMASLAGVPPFLGFWSKLAVLRAAWEGGLAWLTIVGIVFAVIGAFYYLRVIRAMFFDEPEGEPMVQRDDLVLRVVFAANALGLLALGLAWNPIMAWCKQAFA